VDCSDTISSEQLATADMTPGQDDDWVARVQPDKERPGEVHVNVGLAGRECRLDSSGRPWFLEVLHVGEPFAPEQLLGGA
jgi:hypothetical protein